MTHTIACRGFTAHETLPILYCVSCGRIIAIIGDAPLTEGSGPPPAARALRAEPTDTVQREDGEDAMVEQLDTLASVMRDLGRDGASRSDAAALRALILSTGGDPNDQETITAALDVINEAEGKTGEFTGEQMSFEPHVSRRAVDDDTDDRVPPANL